MYPSSTYFGLKVVPMLGCQSIYLYYLSFRRDRRSLSLRNEKMKLFGHLDFQGDFNFPGFFANYKKEAES